MGDLGNYELLEKATVPIYSPDGGKLMDVTVYGKDSKKYISAKHRYKNLNIKAGALLPTSEETERRALELLIELTDTWIELKLNGEPLECNEENKRMVYTKYRWVREQVDLAIHERANFLPGAPKN